MEVESFPRGEVGVGLGIETFDLVVKVAFHAKVTSSVLILF